MPGKSTGNGHDDTAPRNIFDDLAGLRIELDDPATLGVREELTRVPVSRPGKTDFVRVHPDPEMSIATTLFIDDTERDHYLVAPQMRAALAGLTKAVLLVTTITRAKVISLWPIALPDESGRRNSWSETAHSAAELAKTAWVRIMPDRALNGYRCYKAEGNLTEIAWPEKTLSELMTIAFRDRVIDREDHPIIRRVRGLV
ncbi:MAG: hypothetical protein JOY71_23325 [Acetobacteraceae bacterium]|nr:hypothetical protein [Acetobacteraceae bacterium]MBV8525015.1 hypothetical protein [Acetobacteraceae bacterium]